MWCGVTTRKVASCGCCVGVVSLVFGRRLALVGHRMFLSSFTLAAAITTCSHTRGHSSNARQWRNDGVTAASSDGGPTGGRGPLTVLEFFVINFSVCLVLLSNCYIIVYCIVWFQVQPLMVVGYFSKYVYLIFTLNLSPTEVNLFC